MVDIFNWLFGKRGAAAQSGSPLAIDDEDPRVPGFPTELLAHHKRIEATRRPILAATELEGLAERTDGSQLGGWPWWPSDRPYPMDGKGAPLHLLIQINFDDAPVLEGFPQAGLLQIFIGGNDLYGMDDGTAQPAFTCVYHPATDAEARRTFDDIELPFDLETPLADRTKAVPLSFQRTTMILDTSNGDFEAAFPEIASQSELAELFADINKDVANIRLGGYPTFTQFDPRADDRFGITFTHITLLTIDSTSNIMWGDVGVASFYISPADLEKRDFSNVKYYWDCC